MLLRDMEIRAPEFKEGLTLGFEVNPRASHLKIGLMNLPDIEKGGRLWVKVLARDAEGGVVNHMAKWRSSTTSGVPARAVPLGAGSVHVELPTFALPQAHGREVAINISGKRRLFGEAVSSAARLYVVARDGLSGAETVTFRGLN